MDNLVEIRFDGQRFGNWQSVSIHDSIDDLCASVQLGVTAPGTGQPLGLSINTLIQVLVDGNQVMVIRPGKNRRKVGIEDHIVRLEGRSLARELVDCQYSITLSGLKLAEIAKRICETFKVPLKVDAKTAIVPQFSMQCETPANALINAARVGNLLLYPSADGGLILTTPSDAAPVATLIYGEHFTEYELFDDYDLRFSEYVVKSFDYSAGSALKGAVKDAGIGYFRPMHIVADRHGTGTGSCDRRAELERNRRLAKAHQINLSLPSWYHEKGLWQLNQQVRVVIPHEEVDGVFLIGDRTFSQDEKNASSAQLQVLHRNAFVGEQPTKKKHRSGVKK